MIRHLHPVEEKEKSKIVPVDVILKLLTGEKVVEVISKRNWRKDKRV